MAYHVPDAGPAPGFYCPVCARKGKKANPLTVQHTERSAPGIITRYRKCLVCRYTRATEERTRTKKEKVSSIG